MREPFKVGDEILVYATVTSVVVDAWGPNTGPLYGIKIVTADAGDSDTWASYAEPRALVEAVAALSKEIDEVGLYLAGSPHPEDHQVSVALEAHKRVALRGVE